MTQVNKQLIADKISTLTQALYLCRKNKDYDAVEALLDTIDINIELLQINNEPVGVF